MGQLRASRLQPPAAVLPCGRNSSIDVKEPFIAQALDALGGRPAVVSQIAGVRRLLDMKPTDAQAASQHVRSVVDRLFTQGVERRDPLAYFESTYHPEVLIHEAGSLPYGGTYRGLDGAARHALAFLRTWDALQPGDARRPQHRIHALPDRAFVTWSLTTIDPANGQRRSLPAISHYLFENGLIIESWMHHFDTAKLLGLAWEAQHSCVNPPGSWETANDGPRVVVASSGPSFGCPIGCHVRQAGIRRFRSRSHAATTVPSTTSGGTNRGHYAQETYKAV